MSPDPDDAGQKSVATIAGEQAPLRPTAVPDVDPENPPEEFTDALDADDFVVYGKASIEKFDDGGQNSDTPEILDLSPDVVEKALERFFESEKAPGIISIGHDDIPVGRPLREYELDEATAIEVDGETYEFEAGDTITTHVEDADGDDRPELWLVADLANDTEIHRKARLGVLTGELDGFSVTFGRVDAAREGEGRRVTDWDLYSVTLAPDDLIANKGSEFDLAAFKASMNSYLTNTRGDDATTGFDAAHVAEHLARSIGGSMSDSDIDEDKLLARLGQKLTGGSDDTEESSTDNDAEAGDDAGQKEDDDETATEDLIVALAEDMDVSPDEVQQALASITQSADDEEDEMEEDDEDEDDEDGQKADDDEDESAGGETVTIDFGEKLEEHGVVTEDELGEKLEEYRETIVDDVGAKLAEANEEAVEEIAQKMQSGDTPNPAGGSFQDAEDFESHVSEVAEKEGW